MFPVLLRGLLTTLEVALVAIVLAALIALPSGLARARGPAWMRWPAAVYVEIFRGTSALVQLFWFYFVLPLFGLELSAYTAGVLVLALNTGAYGAEVVRGAVAAVPREQQEAAQALGLHPARTLYRVILPQAVPLMLPPAGNLAIELVKNSALVSLITIHELTFSAQLLRAETLRSAELFSLVLLLYFGVAMVIMLPMRALERRAGRGLDRQRAR
jgi:polar amino acid transport system permease protein